MTILYSCRHDGDQFRISKFDEHGEVLSSYLCTESECDCPAGHRRMCRHREMLPLFIRRNAVNSAWWLDYDRGGWVQVFDETPAMTSEGAELPSEASTTPAIDDNWRDTVRAVNIETTTLVDENDCPGHVASANDPKVCAHCGVHIDSLRPPEDHWLTFHPLPKGVQMFDIDNTLGIHNAIASAVGEPEAMIQPIPTPRKSWRRF